MFGAPELWWWGADLIWFLGVDKWEVSCNQTVGAVCWILTRWRQVWCVCSVKAVWSTLERFRSDAFHVRRYTNVMPLILPLPLPLPERRPLNRRACVTCWQMLGIQVLGVVASPAVDSETDEERGDEITTALVIVSILSALVLACLIVLIAYLARRAHIKSVTPVLNYDYKFCAFVYYSSEHPCQLHGTT